LKARGFVVTVAAILAVLATGAVYLYVRGVQNNNGGGSTVSVSVSKEDIAVNTKLNDVIARGGLTFRKFPKADVVRGAVTNVDQIRGQVTSAAIVAGEQISTARLVGSVSQPTGGILGIPAGYEALTLSLQAPQAGGGVVQPGDHISVFAQFSNVIAFQGPLSAYLSGNPPANSAGTKVPDFIATIVPDAQVLKVVQGVISAGSQQSNVALTLALKPSDVALVVTAQLKGTIWVSLLPPSQQGQAVPPSGLSQLINAR